MEDFHDNDWTDVIVVASGGQFTDLKGDTAYFSVPHPSKKVGQSTSDSGQTVKVFNTVDYINKARGLDAEVLERMGAFSYSMVKNKFNLNQYISAINNLYVGHTVPAFNPKQVLPSDTIH